MLLLYPNVLLRECWRNSGGMSHKKAMIPCWDAFVEKHQDRQLVLLFFFFYPGERTLDRSAVGAVSKRYIFWYHGGIKPTGSPQAWPTKSMRKAFSLALTRCIQDFSSHCRSAQIDCVCGFSTASTLIFVFRVIGTPHRYHSNQVGWVSGDQITDVCTQQIQFNASRVPRSDLSHQSNWLVQCEQGFRANHPEWCQLAAFVATQQIAQHVNIWKSLLKGHVVEDHPDHGPSFETSDNAAPHRWRHMSGIHPPWQNGVICITHSQWAYCFFHTAITSYGFQGRKLHMIEVVSNGNHLSRQTGHARKKNKSGEWEWGWGLTKQSQNHQLHRLEAILICFFLMNEDSRYPNHSGLGAKDAHLFVTRSSPKWLHPHKHMNVS